MNEYMELTAERSLEIIAEQIAQSRKTVSKHVGQALFVSGLYTMGMAVVVAIINIIAGSNGFNPLGHLLWFLLPVVIWLAIRNIHKEEVPVSLVGRLVGKTWRTFAFFALGVFLFGNIWNIVMGHICPPNRYGVAYISISSVIVLLMSMATSITGHILKSRWLVWFGIIAGLLVGVGDSIGVFVMLIDYFSSPLTVGYWYFVRPCPTIFFLALIGLTLPGWMLIKQK